MWCCRKGGWGRRGREEAEKGEGGGMVREYMGVMLVKTARMRARMRGEGFMVGGVVRWVLFCRDIEGGWLY